MTYSIDREHLSSLARVDRVDLVDRADHVASRVGGAVAVDGVALVAVSTKTTIVWHRLRLPSFRPTAPD